MDNLSLPEPPSPAVVAPKPPASWLQSKWLAAAELMVVVLIFIADFRHYIPFSKTPFY